MNYVFHDLVFQDMNSFGNIFQDLAATVMKSDTFSRLGIPSFEMFFLAIPCPQVLTMIALFKTWLSNSWRLLSQIISTLDPSKNFHDMVFQDMNTSEHDCQDLAATGLILTFLFQDLVSQVLKCYSFFAIPCPQVLTMIALFKTWLSKPWNLLGQTVSTLAIRPLPKIMSLHLYDFENIE